MAGHDEYGSSNGYTDVPPWEQLNLGGGPVATAAPVTNTRQTVPPAGAPPTPSSSPDAWRPSPPRPAGLGQRVLGSLGGWFKASANEVALPEEEDASPHTIEHFISSTPPWLVSMIVHFTFMIGLGLIVLESHAINQSKMSVDVDLTERPDKQEKWAETIGDQLETPTPFASTEGLTEGIPSLPTRSGLTEVDDPLIGPPRLALSGGEGPMAAGTEDRPNIGLALSGRQEGMKKVLGKIYGGTESTERAVQDGLQWIIRRQKSNGLWSLSGPYKDGSNTENEEAATAMCLLALQGDGHTPESTGEEGYRKACARGWTALLKRLQPDGRFYSEVAQSHQLYTQAQCTIALCELYGMTRNQIYREPAQRAVDYCVRAQAPQGGWRYQPAVDSDMSVTGWMVMALQSARMAGLEVPSPTLERVKEFLDAVGREDGSRYAYQLRAGATLPLTAEGLLCRQYLGWDRDDARLRAGVDYIVANLPDWNERNVYYWYYATQVCHHMEGTDWTKWNNVMRQLLPDHQEKRGTEKGSWSPAGDRWPQGGRLYVTCLSIYMLEVYYRHLPLYQKGIMGK